MSPSIPTTSMTCVTRRMPSRMRLTCAIRWTAAAIWVRTACEGRLMPVIPTMFSSRVSASRGELAWIVDIEPSWPVFIACSTSSASAPRISPRMMRSGRMRRAFRSRSRIVISPVPSRLGGRVSSRTTCGCCSCSSAASSIVTVRSAASIIRDRALSRVVLPEPVPPEIRMLSRQRAAIFSNVAICGEMLACCAMVSRVIDFFENLRIEMLTGRRSPAAG